MTFRLLPLLLGSFVRGLRTGKMASHHPSVVLEATGKHTATVIFLHGLGDSGHGWSPVFGEIRRPHIKYVLPHAPSVPVTLNMGMTMPAWYDLFGLEEHDQEDEAGLKRGAAFVTDLVAKEVAAGIDPKRIVIGGFSMGGALAVYTALTHAPLGGVLALSCWLPLRSHFPKDLKTTATPFWMAHGDKDMLVRLPAGQGSATAMQAMGVGIEFTKYPGMGHSVSDEEIRDIRLHLDKWIP